MADLHIASLQALFKPKSIAVIGASADVKKIGGRPIEYLKQFGFTGKIFPINPGRSEIQGLKTYPLITDVPEFVDLALLAIPASKTLEAIKQCAEKKVGAAIIFSAGFAEVGNEGIETQEAIRSIAKENSIRLLGPNCLGFINLIDSVTGSFALLMQRGVPKIGRVGLITQSGATGSYVFSRSREIGMGISYWISTGNEVDVQVSDCIAYLADDPDTDVIAVQVEGTKDGERMKAALKRAFEKRKPVVFLKTGTSDVGAKAAASHTASLAGSDSVYDSMLKQYGVYRAKTLRELVDIAYTVSQVGIAKGNRVCVLTNSGGIGILTADELTEAGMELPQLSAAGQKQLLDYLPFATATNPVDVTAQLGTQPELLGQFLEVCCQEGIFDQFIIFMSYFGLQKDIISLRLKIIEPVREKNKDIPMLFVSLFNDETRKIFTENKMPVFEDTLEAVSATKALSYFGENFKNKEIQSPAEITPAADPGWTPGVALTEDTAKELLAKYNIPVTREKTVMTESEAVEFAAQLGFPVVLKGMSPDILHKTDAGIVYLNVQNAEEVKKAFREIEDKINNLKAKYTGVSVQEMLTGGIEVIVGTKLDPLFGPTVMVGMGGIYTEVLHDTSLRLAPIKLDEAEKMISELKAFPILKGVRGEARADIEALAQLLVDMGDYAVKYKDFISDIDMNPVKVFVEGKGVRVVDVLIIPKA